MRLARKVAVVVGAGQTPGSTVGNGRAAAITFAREGARLLLVDRRIDSAEETAAMLDAESACFEADVTREEDCRALVEACMERYGRIDILHNNVGIGAGDAGPVHLTEEAWDRIVDTNLKSMWMTCKHALPVMREQGGGAIVNVSSLASVAATPLFAYKVTKAGVNALTQQIAIGNARHGIRCNAILPGLMDTPMAVEGFARMTGASVEEVRAGRDEQVPLGGKQGTAWDVANAALFLASDEAAFITGALLPVDGGQGLRVG